MTKPLQGGAGFGNSSKADRVCRAFENRWIAGERPHIEDYLEDSTDRERDELLRGLVSLELVYRRRGGESPSWADYEDRFPEFSEQLASLFLQDREHEKTMGESDSSTLEPKLQEAATIIPKERDSESPQLPQSLSTVGPEDVTLKPSIRSVTWADNPAETQSLGAQLRSFGDYELLGEVARGGMGVVYKARQISLNRIVALKMILAGQLASEQDVQRFHLEAEAAANLDHSGIVPIYEIGEHEGQHYFSMGFVEGDSLSNRVSDGPLPSLEAADITKKVAEAIAYAHDRGVIHRDLKPANILLEKDGQPKVTDFGLAKRVEVESGLTATGQVLGTPGFMPPEQAAGEAEQMGPLLDVYSLGAILYNLLTGRPPFQAASVIDTLMQVLEREPVPPRQLNTDVNRDLETICLRCLDKDPARRYESAHELTDELQRFLNGEPIRSRPVSNVERAWRWCKRKPLLAGLGTAVASLAVFVAITAPLVALQQSSLRESAESKGQEARAAQLHAEERQEFAEEQQKRAEDATAQEEEARQRAERLRSQAEEAQGIAERAKEALTKEKETADQKLYARTVSLAYQEWLGNNVGRAEGLLDSTPNQYRGWEWDYLKGLCHADLLTLRGHQAAALRVRFNKSGKRLVSLGSDRLVHVWNTDNAQIVKTHRVQGIAISADGLWVAAIRPEDDARIRVFNVLEEDPPKFLAGHKGGTNFGAFSADGLRLATVGRDKTVRVWDLTTQQELLKIDFPSRRTMHPLNFSPDGRLLAWKTMEGWVVIHDAGTGKQLHRFREDRGGTVPLSQVAFSPDSRRMATTGFDGHVRVYNPMTGNRLATLHGHKVFVYSVAFSPDGRRLASAGYDKTVRVWDVDEFRELFVLRGHTVGTAYGVLDVAFSSDGLRLASAGYDTTIKIWDARPERVTPQDTTDVNSTSSQDKPTPFSFHSRRDPSLEYVTLEGHTNAVQNFSFSQDSGRLATASWDGSVKIFDVKTTREVLSFTEHNRSVGCVAHSPDGRLIASAEGGHLSTKPGKILIWESQNGKVVHSLSGHTTPISVLQFTSDGTRLASAGGSQSAPYKGEVKIWDVKSGAELVNVKGLRAGVRSLAVSPDGEKLVTGGNGGTLRLWKFATGEHLRDIGEPLAFFGLAFSSDGGMLAGAAHDSSVRVWNVETWEETWKLQGHTGPPFSVAFSPDGRRLISGSVDGTVKIWDPVTGQELLSLRDDSEVYSTSYSPDGRLVASGVYGGIITIRGAKFESSAETDHWPPILADNFNRDEIGDQWNSGTNWSIEDGVMRGVLQPGSGINAATLILKAIPLPSQVDVRFDVWSPNEIIFEAKFHDQDMQNGILPIYVGRNSTPFLSGAKGVAVLVQSAGGFLPVAGNSKTFAPQPNQRYRLRVVRDGERLTMYADNEEVLTATIPILHAPYLHLQGSFGNAGDVINIDNLEIRVPESATDESQALALVETLFDRLTIKELVQAHLHRNKELDESVRRLALEVAEARRSDVGKRYETLWNMLIEGSNEASDYDLLFEIVSQGGSGGIELKKHELQTMFALAQFRTGKYQECIASIAAAHGLFQRMVGHAYPVFVAFRAMAHHHLGHSDAAWDSLNQLRDLMRSEYWMGNDESQKLRKQAESLIHPPKNLDQRIAKEIEAIKDVTFKPQEAGWTRYDLDGWMRQWTHDAKNIDGRTATSDKYDVVIPLPQLQATRKLRFQGAPPTKSRLVRNNVQVDLNGLDAVVHSDMTSWFVDGVYRRSKSTSKLRKTSDGWKTFERRSWGIERNTGKETVSLNEAAWRDLDLTVEDARKSGDPHELSQALADASRLEEAFGVARKLTEQQVASARDWAARADLAFWFGDADDMRYSLKKAVALDPQVDGDPYVRAFAVRNSLPSAGKILKHSIRVCIPEYVTEAPLTDIRVPGEVCGAWYPTSRSVVTIFFGKDEAAGDTINSLKKEFENVFVNALHAKIIKRDVCTVAGCQAISFVIEGKGNGKGIVPGGTVATIMRWVAIIRGDDLIGCLIGAPNSVFDNLNSEFEVILETLEFETTDDDEKNP